MKVAECNGKHGISVGYLSYQKGFGLLAESWSKMSVIQLEWYLHISDPRELTKELQFMLLAEAIACGPPCISFNCPCVPSDIITFFVKKGKNCSIL